MELLQLRYFLEAAEYENFSRVASNHLVPQPSISKTIKKLESELGVTLFDRKGKHVVLNENGKYFYSQIHSAINTMDQAISHLKNNENKNITLYAQAGARFVSLLIADFLTSTQGIFLSTVNRMSDGTVAPYDFTFMQPVGNMAGYNYENLMEDEIVAVIANTNPLSREPELSIKDLKDETFVGYYRSINLRDFTDKYCMEKGGFTPNVVFETHDYAALRYMIDKGKGIALMPKKFFMLQHSNQVTIVPLKEIVYRNLIIAWDKNKILSSCETDFLYYTKKWFRNFLPKPLY